MAFLLYRANRVERLRDAFMDVIATSTGDPFTPEQVMVQNPGMATWLQRNTSERFGICANVAYLFPRKIIQNVFAAVLGDEAREMHAYDPARMLWAVLTTLPQYLKHGRFARLARYLAGDKGDRKRVQLARRIANVFDQYALYRPKMVTDWEAGGHDDWQADMWCALRAQLGGTHVATLTRRFEQALEHAFPAELPSRICCFGISTLPPLYVHVLQLLSRHIDLHLFLLTPTNEYFADIRSRKEIHRVLNNRPQYNEEDLALEEGHPLLASLGRMGRDFQQVLEEHTLYQDRDLFGPPPGKGMLAVLQGDMLALRRRGLEAGQAPRLVLEPEDQSISIHSCHTAMREIEVLRDQLLRLLLEKPELGPGDIIVMMPDVEAYAPLIEAVFGETGPRHLPFAIADRTFRGASPAIDAFFRVLDLQHTRLTATEVLDLLALGPVSERFGIPPGEMDMVAQWVAGSGIRWGMDANHRADFQQPRSQQNTWRFGLERLLLGMAMPADGGLYEHVLPREEVEGSDAALLGKLTHFCQSLFEQLQRLEGRRSMEQWQRLLLRTLDSLIAADGENEWQHQQVRAALDALVKEAGEGGFADTLDLEAVRALLEDRIEYENEGWNFMAEGITFCAMVPMRSIPFPVVCMIGMNDLDFPRGRRPESFDKIAENPRPGDRSKRNEERYLFLEAILAARERLIITFQGRDIKDNTLKPPSVVVSELIDVLGESFYLPDQPDADRRAMARRLVIEHPMQGFNPIYFDPDNRPDLFSYAEGHYQGARGFLSRDHLPPVLFTGPLPPSEQSELLALDDLIRFFQAPLAWMLRARFGFTLTERELHLADREPLELSGLDKYRVGTEVLARRLDGITTEELLKLSRGEGHLPLGVPGVLGLEALEQEIKPLVQAARELSRKPLPPHSVYLPLENGITITGKLTDRYEDGLLWYAYKRLSGKQLVTAWIKHLSACAQGLHDQRLMGHWLGRGDRESVVRVSFDQVADPVPLLRDLVDLYQAGLSRPLLFFPKAAWKFVSTTKDDKRMSHARYEWFGSTGSNNPGFSENQDIHFQRLFRDRNPLEESFRLFPEDEAEWSFPFMANRILGPLVEHLANPEEVRK